MFESVRASWIKQLQQISTLEHGHSTNQSDRSSLNSESDVNLSLNENKRSSKKLRVSLIRHWQLSSVMIDGNDTMFVSPAEGEHK